jgi:hypothetical protein
MSAAIPPVKGFEPQLSKMLAALKENVDELRGRLVKQEKIKLLDANASQAQIVAKVNEVLRLLQP